MKPLCHLTLWTVLVFALGNLEAQIPNNGFENWLDIGTHMNPEGWWTTNDSIMSGSYFPITRSADHYPENVGSYSIRLENNVDLYPDWASMGIAWTGGFKGNDNPAFPVNGHPNSLWGYFKFFPQNGDTFEIHTRLYSNGIDVSGGSFKYSGVVDNWTPFQLLFSEYEYVDSGRIFISSCYDNDEPIPHGNSVLYIDNLNFDSLITNISPELGHVGRISIYPVPATNRLLLSEELTGVSSLNLEICSSNGHHVMSGLMATGCGVQSIDVSMLPAGVYIVRVWAGNEIIHEQRIVLLKES